MAITRVTAVWSGFTGAPGYTNFFFDAFGGGDLVDSEVDRTVAFFEAISAVLPNSVSVQVQQEAAVLDESSGALINYALATEAPDPITGDGGTNYSAASGASVTWNTEAIARGRRLRGRTFIVPMGTNWYDPQGTINSNGLSWLNAGAEALIGDGSGPQLVIWSRPRDGAGGTIGQVVSHRVADQVAVLRSRRD